MKFPLQFFLLLLVPFFLAGCGAGSNSGSGASTSSSENVSVPTTFIDKTWNLKIAGANDCRYQAKFRADKTFFIDYFCYSFNGSNEIQYEEISGTYTISGTKVSLAVVKDKCYDYVRTQTQYENKLTKFWNKSSTGIIDYDYSLSTSALTLQNTDGSLNFIQAGGPSFDIQTRGCWTNDVVYGLFKSFAQL